MDAIADSTTTMTEARGGVKGMCVCRSECKCNRDGGWLAPMAVSFIILFRGPFPPCLASGSGDEDRMCRIWMVVRAQGCNDDSCSRWMGGGEGGSRHLVPDHDKNSGTDSLKPVPVLAFDRNQRIIMVGSIIGGGLTGRRSDKTIRPCEDSLSERAWGVTRSYITQTASCCCPSTHCSGWGRRSRTSI